MEKIFPESNDIMFANCHLHSTYSDGIYTPAQLVALAKQVGHRAVVLTDHDTVKGIHLMKKEARRAGLLSLLGCEFIVKGSDTGFHLLGYDFDPENTAMRELIERTSSRHRERCHLLFEQGLKSGALRPGIAWQDVLDASPDNDFFYYTQVFALMEQRGIYRHEEYPQFIADAFTPPKELEPQIEAEIGFFTPDVEEVIHIINRADGISVVAHPHNKQAYIDDLLHMGLRGIETSHPSVLPEEKLFYDALCAEKRLYKLGGTDHASILGGFADLFPKKDRPVDCGNLNEEDFMTLYTRALD